MFWKKRDGKVSIGSKTITSLQYAEDINVLAGEEQELEALDKSLDKTCTRYKMAISAEKTKLIINSANSIQKKIKVKGQQLGTVTSLKYIGVIVSDEGSRMVQATAALTMRIDKNISLMKGETDALSCHIIFLHACMSWTLTAEIEKGQTRLRCYRSLLSISYNDHVTIPAERSKQLSKYMTNS